MNQAGHLRRDRKSWRLIVRMSAEPGGPRRRRSIRLGSTGELKTKHEAETAANRWRAANLSKPMHAGMTVPWPTWCDRFLYGHASMLANGTRKTQSAIVRRHLLPAFEKFAVHEIDNRLIQAWLAWQIETGASATTITARFSVLRRMLRVAEAEGLAVTPPTSAKIRLPRVQTVQSELRAKAFTLVEANRILATAPPVDDVAYAVALYLGLRAGEVVGLAWSAIDLTTGTVQIRQQAIDGELRVLKTKSSAAVLQAPAPLLARLRAYRDSWEPNDRTVLFADPSGRPWRPQVLRDRLRLLLEELGIARHGLHAFRHTAAFALADSGCNPEVIRRALRHASLRQTAAYLSAAPEDVARGLERAANLIGQFAAPASRAQP